MTLTSRLLNLARANLNALLDRVGEQEDGPRLDSMSDEELEAELARRQARREREEQLRREREGAERAARERGPVSGSAGRPRARKAESSRPSPADAQRLAQYYAQLELPVGSDLAQVKAAYRRLLRKYHPDRFQDTQKAALATELTQKLSQAYREIEKALKSGHGQRG